jgi:hypothetical protein
VNEELPNYEKSGRNGKVEMEEHLASSEGLPDKNLPWTLRQDLQANT